MDPHPIYTAIIFSSLVYIVWTSDWYSRNKILTFGWQNFSLVIVIFFKNNHKNQIYF